MIKTNQVYTTNDYSLFTTMEGNRKLNPTHIKRLKVSMSEDYLKIPIIVNGKYQIIDGQHRFQAVQDLGLSVVYMVMKDYGLEQVQRLNTNSSNWKIADYMESYCNRGNKHYIKYRDYKKMYNLGDYESMAMLKGKINGGGHNYDEFRKGLFKVKSGQWGIACEQAEQVLQLGKYYEGYKRRSFVFAMIHLINHENFDLLQLLNKLKYQSTKLVDCTNKEQYLYLLQEIYNFKSSNKVNLVYN